MLVNVQNELTLSETGPRTLQCSHIYALLSNLHSGASVHALKPHLDLKKVIVTIRLPLVILQLVIPIKPPFQPFLTPLSV